MPSLFGLRHDRPGGNGNRACQQIVDSFSHQRQAGADSGDEEGRTEAALIGQPQQAKGKRHGADNHHLRPQMNGKEYEVSAQVPVAACVLSDVPRLKAPGAELRSSLKEKWR